MSDIFIYNADGSYVQNTGANGISILGPDGNLMPNNGSNGISILTSKGTPAVPRPRVNLLLKSNQYSDAAWTKTGLTITDNADGTSALFTDTAITNVHTVRQTFPTTSGFTYTASVRVKRVNRDITLKFRDFASTGREIVFSYNLTTRVATQLRATTWAGTATATADTNDYVICTLTSTVNVTSAGVGFDIGLFDGTTDLYLGVVTPGAYIGNAQVELGTTASFSQRVNTADDFNRRDVG